MYSVGPPLVPGVLLGHFGAMSDHYIFGYGSLVNCATHAYRETHTAQLQGWRRVWQHTTKRDVAFLNVVPDKHCVIDGLMMAVPREAPELAAREYAYGKFDVTHQVRTAEIQAGEVNLWSIPSEDRSTTGAPPAVLLSYIDVVIAGYLDHFGRDGAARFFATTSGWNVPIWDDRAQPQYPRAQPLTGEVRAIVDAALGDLPCWVTRPGSSPR